MLAVMLTKMTTMINLENRIEIIKKELSELENLGYKIVEESIYRHEDSHGENIVTVVYDSPKRQIKIQYFDRLNNKSNDNILEYTYFDFKAKDITDYYDLNVNHFIRLTYEKLYYAKYNTYNTKKRDGHSDSEFSVIIKSYMEFFHEKLLNVINGDDWIANYIDRLDGWTIRMKGKIIKTEI
jgi:hypothetical protein